MNKRVPHWPQKNRGFLFKVHAFGPPRTTVTASDG